MPIKSSYGKDPIISNLIPLSKEFNVPIAPVGTAFRLFQERYPNISLFTSDNKHPSPVGTYLAACIFYRMITKKNSKGLPRRFTTEDKNGIRPSDPGNNPDVVRRGQFYFDLWKRPNLPIHR